MDKTLFNSLFDREIHNPDFLRGRVAGCIKYIGYYIKKNIKNGYNDIFYEATMMYNENLITNFGVDFISSTLEEFNNFQFF